MNINRHTNNFYILRPLFAVIMAIIHAATLSGVRVATTISQYIISEVAAD